ncbi:MAG: MFS transporter, partial [Halobacteria archaeon]|nr:MFS transporter [Halobacteria archaeon]
MSESVASNRRLVTLGVLLGVFLAGIEGTVVSTAMPTVVKSLGGLRLYSWVFAAYMLFAAVSMPILGKLSDIYGRKKLFLFGVVAFVAGSVLSGAAQSMTQLIAFRTL